MEKARTRVPEEHHARGVENARTEQGVGGPARCVGVTPPRAAMGAEAAPATLRSGDLGQSLVRVGGGRVLHPSTTRWIGGTGDEVKGALGGLLLPLPA